MSGTLLDASVSEMSVLQLAFLPRADVYCGATPTEDLPILDKAVSSIIS